MSRFECTRINLFWCDSCRYNLKYHRAQTIVKSTWVGLIAEDADKHYKYSCDWNHIRSPFSNNFFKTLRRCDENSPKMTFCFRRNVRTLLNDWIKDDDNAKERQLAFEETSRECVTKFQEFVIDFFRGTCPDDTFSFIWMFPSIHGFFTSFLKNGPFAASFFLYFRLFYKQLTVNKRSIKVADDWIRTRVLWDCKRPLCQLRHNHFPCYSRLCSAIICDWI